MIRDLAQLVCLESSVTHEGFFCPGHMPQEFKIALCSIGGMGTIYGYGKTLLMLFMDYVGQSYVNRESNPSSYS